MREDRRVLAVVPSARLGLHHRDGALLQRATKHNLFLSSSDPFRFPLTLIFCFLLLLCNFSGTQTDDSWVPRFFLHEVNFSRGTHEPPPPTRSWRNSSLSGGLSMGLHLGVWSPAMGPAGVCARREIIHGSSCGPSPFCTDYILIYLVMSYLCVR